MGILKFYIFMLAIIAIAVNTKAQSNGTGALIQTENGFATFSENNETSQLQPSSSESIPYTAFEYTDVTGDGTTQGRDLSGGITTVPIVHLEDAVLQASFMPSMLSIPEKQVQPLTVSLTCTACRDLDISVSAAVLDKYLAVISPSATNMTYTGNDSYVAAFNITTLFLGRTSISFYFASSNTTGMAGAPFHQTTLALSVERVIRFIDTLFDIMMQVFLVVSTATFGCDLDLTMMKGYFKKPVGAGIGLLCQYAIMPSVSLLFDYIFDLPLFIDYGLLAYSSCPGGGASNIYTSLLGGEINLSITMTFVSTVASLAFLPMWMYTAGTALTGAEAQIPFTDILSGLAMIVIPVFSGIFFKRFIPRFAVIFVKVMRPISFIGVLFLTGAGFYINYFIIEIVINMGWKVAVPCVCLPYVGILMAMAVAALFRQSWDRVKAIGIETGVQNIVLAVVLLRSSLKSPALQLSAVGPVVAALATPIPIVFAILFRAICLRCKGVKVEADAEKDGTPVDLKTNGYSKSCAQSVASNKPFPGVYRLRSETTDTLVSDEAMAARQDSLGTMRTSPESSPPEACQDQLEIQEMSAINLPVEAVIKGSERSWKHCTKKLFSRHAFAKNNDTIVSSGTFRETADEDPPLMIDIPTCTTR